MQITVLDRKELFFTIYVTHLNSLFKQFKTLNNIENSTDLVAKLEKMKGSDDMPDDDDDVG